MTTTDDWQPPLGMTKPASSKRPFLGGNSRKHGGTLTRFVNEPRTEPSPRDEAGLSIRHSAVIEGRSLFPTRVFSALDRPQVLLSGHSNAKIGSRIIKGAWAGFPIFTLSLEERATCPSSCGLWNECYGNALPMGVRFRYDTDLMVALDRNLNKVAEAYPRGFAIRLHVLGDFPDIAYAMQWHRWLLRIPQLHVWGYTARPMDQKIGRYVLRLNDPFPERWAFRSSVLPSTPAAPMQAATVWAGDVSDGIVCPAETGKTRTCGTCALCWAPAASDVRIVFLGHGMRKRNSPHQEKAA